MLLANKAEPLYTMSDMHSDNFAMFRYELNSIIRQHQYINEDRTDRYMGRNPLSKVDGKQFKDLDDKELRQYEDMFRPPGVVRLQDYKYLSNKKQQGSISL